MPTGGQALPLRGRDSDVVDLVRVLERAASGHLSLAVIEGEPGIGKSRLLAEVLQAGRIRSMEVRTARALELEQTRPFGVLVEALGCAPDANDPRRRAIAELLATRTGEAGPITISSDASLRFQAVDAFVDLVESSALQRPMLLGLDDLHWADASSLLTLDALARELPDLPMAIICCRRPAPRGAEASTMTAGFSVAGASVLELQGVDRDALRALVRDCLAAEPGERLMAELAVANGNPLFVTELLAALDHENAITVVDGSAELDPTGRPPTLRLTVLRRLSSLSDDALDVLRAASILGTRFSVSDLAATTHRSVLALSPALREAVAGNVLEEDGTRLRFRHDLIREAVYTDLPESVRLAMHREAGQRLAEAGAPALQVAEHLTRSASPGDAQTIHWLTRAAREVAASSPLVAGGLIQHAAELCVPTDPERDGLLAEGAISLWWGGRFVEAEEICRTMLDRDHDPAVDGQIRTCLVNLLLARDATDEALHHLGEMSTAPGASDAERAATWALIAYAEATCGELRRADAAAQQARALSDAVDDPAVQAFVLWRLSMVSERRADLGQALLLAGEAVRSADHSPDHVAHHWPVHLNRARILLALDRFAEARAALQAGREVSEQVGTSWLGPTLGTTLALERFFVGEWDDALAEAETAERLARGVDEGYNVAVRAGVVAAMALHRGDLPGSQRAIDLVDRTARQRFPRYGLSWLALARSLLLEAEGAAQDGLTVLADHWDACLDEALTVTHPVVGPDLVRLALLAGQQSRAAQVCAALVDLTATPDDAWFCGAAMRCRGLLEHQPELSMAAADAYTRAGRPLETALSREDAAAMLTGDAAISQLTRARAGFEHLGAARDVARVDARLRALGVRRGQRGTRGRPTSGWASLTPTERTVVDLVAQGLSNPQIGERLFVSRRTVQTHVAHVFTKLDISSRAQLAAEAARQA